MALTQRKVQVVFCDMDNTSVGSDNIALMASCKYSAKLWGEKGWGKFKFDPDQYRTTFVATPYRAIYPRLLEMHGLPAASPEEIEHQAGQELLHVMGTFNEMSLEPAEGMIPALRKIQTPERKFAFVSSSPPTRVQICRTNAGFPEDLFPPNHVFGSQVEIDGRFIRPKRPGQPDVYLLALEAFELRNRPEEAIAIEDSVHGAVAAIEAGIPTIGYVWLLPEGERRSTAQALLDAGTACVMWHWDFFPQIVASIEAGKPLPRSFGDISDVGG